MIVLDDAGPHPDVQPRRHPHPARAAGGVRGPAAGRGAGAGEPSAHAVQQQFDDFLDERTQHGLDHWQQSFELNAAQHGAPQANVVTLVARGAEMPGRRRGCWCSTTSPRSSRPSARRPGARWRAAWRTRSRTR